MSALLKSRSMRRPGGALRALSALDLDDGAARALAEGRAAHEITTERLDLSIGARRDRRAGDLEARRARGARQDAELAGAGELHDHALASVAALDRHTAHRERRGRLFALGARERLTGHRHAFAVGEAIEADDEAAAHDARVVRDRVARHELEAHALCALRRRRASDERRITGER
jgi:hypothetical protein